VRRAPKGAKVECFSRVAAFNFIREDCRASRAGAVPRGGVLAAGAEEANPRIPKACCFFSCRGV